jgi:hypothetical protein
LPTIRELAWFATQQPIQTLRRVSLRSSFEWREADLERRSRTTGKALGTALQDVIDVEDLSDHLQLSILADGGEFALS